MASRVRNPRSILFAGVIVVVRLRWCRRNDKIAIHDEHLLQLLADQCVHFLGEANVQNVVLDRP